MVTPAMTRFFRPVFSTAARKFSSLQALTMPVRLMRAAKASGTMSASSGSGAETRLHDDPVSRFADRVRHSPERFKLSLVRPVHWAGDHVDTKPSRPGFFVATAGGGVTDLKTTIAMISADMKDAFLKAICRESL